MCMMRLCYFKAGVCKSVCLWQIHVWVRGMFCFQWGLAVLALINIHFGLFILIGLLTWWILAVPRSKRIINFGSLVILGGNFGPFRSGRWRAAEVVICRFSVFYFLIITIVTHRSIIKENLQLTDYIAAIPAMGERARKCWSYWNFNAR